MSKLDIVLDATMFDTFVSCPQKYFLRFIRRKSSTEKAAPLDKGDLIHKGLEPYFKALQLKKSFEECLNDAKQGIDLAATESDLEPNEIRFLKNVLIENVTFWQARDNYFEIVAVEKPFAYVLYEDEYIRITMIGKIDLLVNEDRWMNLPYDHKTYSRDFPIRKRTNQFQNYAFAMKSSYVVANRIGLQTSLSPEKKYKRDKLSYDEELLEQWRTNVVRWVKFYVDCVADNSFPMNETSCDKYNRLCEYNDVCDTANEEARVYKLNTNFRDSEKWDVAKSLGLEK